MGAFCSCEEKKCETPSIDYDKDCPLKGYKKDCGTVDFDKECPLKGYKKESSGSSSGTDTDSKDGTNTDSNKGTEVEIIKVYDGQMLITIFNGWFNALKVVIDYKAKDKDKIIDVYLEE